MKDQVYLLNEVRIYWTACQGLNSDDAETVDEALDQLGLIVKHTDNPVLKAQSSKMLDLVVARTEGRRATG